MNNDHTTKINKSAPNVLIIRNDKLGDFMLTYPVYSLIKQVLPEINIHVLVPKYTVPMAQMCQDIDNIIIDPGEQANFKQQYELFRTIKQQQFSAVICLYSTTRIGIISYLAKIPYRLAPATKLAQIFYNQTLTQRRSQSRKPEYEYNLDLARRYLLDFKLPQHDKLTTPYLRIAQSNRAKVKNQFIQQHKIANDTKLLFIHPGSGGSANNLSNQQYFDLIHLLVQCPHVHIIVTLGPDETKLADEFSTALHDVSHTIFVSQQGLENFTQFINIADLFISGSTGPLHIAGALDVATVAFYPNRRSATSLRWQTLNSKHKRLFFSPKDALSEDMTSIDIKQVSNSIITHYELADH